MGWRTVSKRLTTIGQAVTKGIRKLDSGDLLLLAFALLIGWALYDLGAMWLKVWAGACCLALAVARMADSGGTR